MIDLAAWIHEEFRVSISEAAMSRLVRRLGYAKLSARPRHHDQNELAVKAFKKNFPALLAEIRAGLPPGTEIELWWQDEARVGQSEREEKMIQ